MMGSLVEASLRGRPTVVDGVTLVLRHPDLDRARMEPATILGRDHPERGGPPMIFPWTPKSQRKLILKQPGAVEVLCGDIVYVARLEQVSFSTTYGQFDHPDNRNAVRAVLGVLRPDGGSREVPAGLLFVGREATIRPGTPPDERRDLRHALIERLNGRCGFDVTGFLGLDPDEWPAIPQHLLQSERHALLALVEGDPSEEPHEVAFGYWMARAEAEVSLLPAGKQAAARKDGDRAKGKKGGAQNRARARARWAQAGLEIARRLRTENPSLGQKALASAMMIHPDLPDASPDQEGLKAAIRNWEREGELPKSITHRG